MIKPFGQKQLSEGKVKAGLLTIQALLSSKELPYNQGCRAGTTEDVNCTGLHLGFCLAFLYNQDYLFRGGAAHSGLDLSGLGT